MKSFTLIPHTGEAAIKVEANTLEKLFTASLEGMNRILKKNYEKDMDRHSVFHEILLSSLDTTSLLIDFLSEILTLSTINKIIFSVDFLEIKENHLHAHLIGAKVNNFMTDIKAVTYHKADIKRNEKGNLEAVIIFDI